MERAKEKFECQCGTYDTDLEIEFDEDGGYCPKCGGYCVLAKEREAQKEIKMKDFAVMNKFELIKECVEMENKIKILEWDLDCEKKMRLLDKEDTHREESNDTHQVRQERG
jgi:hypothetical protein